jgi:hypothetical protein
MLVPDVEPAEQGAFSGQPFERDTTSAIDTGHWIDTPESALDAANGASYDGEDDGAVVAEASTKAAADSWEARQVPHASHAQE